MSFLRLFAARLLFGGVSLACSATSPAQAGQRTVDIACQSSTGVTPTAVRNACVEVKRYLSQNAPGWTSTSNRKASLHVVVDVTNRSAYDLSARLYWSKSSSEPARMTAGPVVDVQSVDAPLTDVAYKDLARGLFVVTKLPLE